MGSVGSLTQAYLQPVPAGASPLPSGGFRVCRLPSGAGRMMPPAVSAYSAGLSGYLPDLAVGFSRASIVPLTQRVLADALRLKS